MWRPQTRAMVFTLRINTQIHGSTEVQSVRLGLLGFALAKGLIRGLVDRYPDPSLTTRIN